MGERLAAVEQLSTTRLAVDFEAFLRLLDSRDVRFLVAGSFAMGPPDVLGLRAE